jgi:hypothetical protein
VKSESKAPSLRIGGVAKAVAVDFLEQQADGAKPGTVRARVEGHGDS